MDRVSAAVIGSGFGGLALAIRLQAAGCRTVIFKSVTSREGGHMFIATKALRSTPDRRLLQLPIV